MKVIQGAEEFYLQGENNKGVLLIHGYTGTPAEMRLLGDHLHKLGYTVLGIRLPGHGTSPRELNETTWPMWYETAEQGFDRLHSCCSQVMVAGLSMGALLTMALTAQKPVQRAAFLAAPMFVQDKRAPFLPFLRYFIHYLKKKKRSYFVADKYNLAYDVMPVKPLSSLFALVKLCKERFLPQITVPCIILQSKREHTVRPESAEYIFNRLQSREKKLVWFECSGHILTLDIEREQVFKEIAAFFEK